jgi:hypothetical protein
MSWGERWFLLILVELLTFIQWVEVRCDFCWYWWNCQYHHKSPLNSTHWVIVNNSIKINKNHLSPQLIEWWSTFPPISTKITSTSTHWVMVNNSSNILILVELLTIIQCIEVRGDFCWYWWNCWPSLNELKWEVIFVDIGGIVDHHHHKSPLNSTHWVIVNNSIKINKNHLSPQLIEWWSTIPPISTKITIGGIVDYHAMSLGERWFLLILVELLTISQWVKMRGDFYWYWWNLNDGQQFHQYQ